MPSTPASRSIEAITISETLPTTPSVEDHFVDRYQQHYGPTRPLPVHYRPFDQLENATFYTTPVGPWAMDAGTPYTLASANAQAGSSTTPATPTTPISDRSCRTALGALVPNTTLSMGLQYISGNHPIAIPIPSEVSFAFIRTMRQTAQDNTEFLVREKENIPPLWLANPRSAAYRANPNSPAFSSKPRISRSGLHRITALPVEPPPGISPIDTNPFAPMNSSNSVTSRATSHSRARRGLRRL